MSNPSRTPASSGPGEAIRKVEHEFDEYRHGEDRPLGGYVASMSAYVALATGLTVWARRKGRLPERTNFAELALMGIATHKLSRLITKEPVASPLRAPFARYAGTAGPGELAEDVRGDGLRHAVGELLTCPFCLAQWIATAFVFGSILAPSVTRLAAQVMSTVAASDFLQFVYGLAEKKGE